MILGRSPNLVLGLLMAAFNLVVSFHVAGFAPTTDQVSVVNLFLAALVAVISNVPELAVQAGIKAISRLNASAPGTATPGTDLANKVANGDGIKVIPVDTTPH